MDLIIAILEVYKCNKNANIHTVSVIEFRKCFTNFMILITLF